jgi:predicted enzyme related to lactoylglutathione lyase
MGGMMGAAGAPAHWILYFAVADTDASVAAAESRGGTIVAPTFDTPYGRMAGITDPAGAMFWVMQDTTQTGSEEEE